MGLVSNLLQENCRFLLIATYEDQEGSTTTRIEIYEVGDDDPRGEEKLKNTEDGVIFKRGRM